MSKLRYKNYFFFRFPRYFFFILLYYIDIIIRIASTGLRVYIFSSVPPFCRRSLFLYHNQINEYTSLLTFLLLYFIIDTKLLYKIKRIYFRHEEKKNVEKPKKKLIIENRREKSREICCTLRRSLSPSLRKKLLKLVSLRRN